MDLKRIWPTIAVRDNSIWLLLQHSSALHLLPPSPAVQVELACHRYQQNCTANIIIAEPMTRIYRSCRHKQYTSAAVGTGRWTTAMMCTKCLAFINDNLIIFLLSHCQNHVRILPGSHLPATLWLRLTGKLNAPGLPPRHSQHTLLLGMTTIRLC